MTTEQDIVLPRSTTDPEEAICPWCRAIISPQIPSSYSEEYEYHEDYQTEAITCSKCGQLSKVSRIVDLQYTYRTCAVLPEDPRTRIPKKLQDVLLKAGFSRRALSGSAEEERFFWLAATNRYNLRVLSLRKGGFVVEHSGFGYVKHFEKEGPHLGTLVNEVLSAHMADWEETSKIVKEGTALGSVASFEDREIAIRKAQYLPVLRGTLHILMQLREELIAACVDL